VSLTRQVSRLTHVVASALTGRPVALLTPSGGAQVHPVRRLRVRLAEDIVVNHKVATLRSSTGSRRRDGSGPLSRPTSSRGSSR
jgi:hypothetical protein